MGVRVPNIDFGGGISAITAGNKVLDKHIVDIKTNMYKQKKKKHNNNKEMNKERQFNMFMQVSTAELEQASQDKADAAVRQK